MRSPRHSLVAQRAKDLTLSVLWIGFSPCTGNFCMPWLGQKNKTKNKQTKTGHLLPGPRLGEEIVFGGFSNPPRSSGVSIHTVLTCFVIAIWIFLYHQEKGQTDFQKRVGEYSFYAVYSCRKWSYYLR